MHLSNISVEDDPSTDFIFVSGTNGLGGALMNIGDLLYQLFAFIVLIGTIAGIVFVVKYMIVKQKQMRELNNKLDRLLEEKQKE